MTNAAHPVLCGGTFLTQLLLSRRPTASRRQRTQGVSDAFLESDVLLGLVRIVQPDYIKPAGSTFGTYTTNYKKCAAYTPDDLKFDDSAIVSSFLSRVRAHYEVEVARMAAFAKQYIDIGSASGKDVLLVKRLIELIRDDTGIPDSCNFRVGRGVSAVLKSELTQITEVCLPAFLLSVWAYIISERKDNGFGAQTISAWFPARKDRYAGPDGSTIKQAITLDYGEAIPEKVVDEVVDRDLEPNIATELMIPEGQDVSRDYYNLFVVSGEIKNNRFSVPRNRSLKDDTETVKKFFTLDDVAIARIKTLPTLIMNENTKYGGCTAADQEVYYGFVTNLKFQENGLIRIRFKCIAKVNQQQINDIAQLLDIFTGPGVMELNNTHWTIKNVDLIEELIEADLLPAEHMPSATRKGS